MSEIPGQRIAKVMARAGICSRREAERLIEAGNVTVNGSRITSPATFVTDKDVVVVNGEIVPSKEPTRLWLYHKPKGLVTTHNDPQERPTVFNHLPDNLPRVMSVGRLDLNTEGLLLLTNDGALVRTLEHPSTGWKRHYRVRVFGHIDEDQLKRLKKGLRYRDPQTDKVTNYGAIEATIEHKGARNHWLRMVIAEGKNREIRNICQALNLEVSRLIRVSYGPFELGRIVPGAVIEVPRKPLQTSIKGL